LGTAVVAACGEGAQSDKVRRIGVLTGFSGQDSRLTPPINARTETCQLRYRLDTEMARIHLFEIADQPWCPKIIRRSLTEYLATGNRLTKLYQPTAQISSAPIEGNAVSVLRKGCGQKLMYN
jgi:hypothetical protein